MHDIWDFYSGKNSSHCGVLCYDIMLSLRQILSFRRNTSTMTPFSRCKKLRKHVPPKRLWPRTRPHGVLSQEIIIYTYCCIYLGTEQRSSSWTECIMGSVDSRITQRTEDVKMNINLLLRGSNKIIWPHFSLPRITLISWRHYCSFLCRFNLSELGILCSYDDVGSNPAAGRDVRVRCTFTIVSLPVSCTRLAPVQICNSEYKRN